ncbi:MAG TPA: beta-galactosidase, partial [Armatimonadota bacterium]
FQLYAEKGQVVLRDIILHGLRQLLPSPTLTTSLPVQGLQTVMQQANPTRTIVHLLYCVPVKRGQGIEVIEEIIPLRDISVALRVDTTPSRVYLAPQDTDVPFTVTDGVLHTSVPELNCHQMVVVE